MQFAHAIQSGSHQPSGNNCAFALHNYVEREFITNWYHATPASVPTKITIHVLLNEYILLEEQSNADQNSSSSSSYRPGRGSERSDNNARDMQPRNWDSAQYSQADNDEWQNLERTTCHQAGEADARSEDSEARKHTKSSFLQVGHSRIEVLGKKAVHDHILLDPTRRRKIAAVPHYWRTRIIRQQLHSPKYHTRFAPVRFCQQRTGYPQFAIARVLESCVSVVPATSVVLAWRTRVRGGKKIAICNFEQGFAVSPHSIHCAHKNCRREQLRISQFDVLVPSSWRIEDSLPGIVGTIIWNNITGNNHWS